MTTANLPDASLNLARPFSVTPLAVVLKGLSDAIKVKLPSLSFVYDSTLSYQETMRGQRALRSALQLNTETQFPLFSFSRTVLLPLAQSTYRPRTSSTVLPTDGSQADRKIKQLYALNGQFDMLFRIYSRDIAQLEMIELLYSTRAAITDVTTFPVHIPWLEGAPELTETSNWMYHITWLPLDEMVAQHDPFMNFALAGRATINGTFLAGLLRDSTLVEQINIDAFLESDQGQQVAQATIDVPIT